MLLCFNSLMVRLKAKANWLVKPFLIRFNSLMVRLKGGLVTQLDALKEEFQFPNGSIKSMW